VLGFPAHLTELSAQVCNGLVGLDLAPPTCELVLSLRGGRCEGQHFLGWEDKLRFDTQRATPNDVALGGLFVAAGVAWRPKGSQGRVDTLITDPPVPLSAHDRLAGIQRTLPLLTALGWEQGMALADLAPAARRLNADVDWVQPNTNDVGW
jgi:hypothetical protein